MPLTPRSIPAVAAAATAGALLVRHELKARQAAERIAAASLAIASHRRWRAGGRAAHVRTRS